MEKRQSVIDRRAKGEKERKGLEEREREREANTNFSLRQIEKILLKQGHPRPLFRLFSVFSSKQYNFTTNQCEKVSCPSGIQSCDSNP